jgi:hypothetical protein
VLGRGELPAGVTVKAAAFSESAKAKIEAAGGKVEVEVKKPWNRWAHAKRVEEMAAAGKSYEEEKLKKRVANLASKVRSAVVCIADFVWWFGQMPEQHLHQFCGLRLNSTCAMVSWMKACASTPRPPRIRRRGWTVRA